MKTILPSSTSRSATRLILFSILATGIGQSMTFTLLAPLGREVGLREIQVGLIITCAAPAFTLSSPFWGRCSDRWGRKPILLIGLFGYAGGYILFASVFFFGIKGTLSGALFYLLAIAARVSMAALMSAAPSSATAYMSDTTTAEQRVRGMGQLGAARTLGAILGPAACGLPAIFGLLAPLYIAGGISGLVSACPAAGFILGPIIGISLYQLNHSLPSLCACALMAPLMIYIRMKLSPV